MSQIVHKVKNYEIFNKIIDVSQLGKTYKGRNVSNNIPTLIIVLDSANVLKESQKNSKEFMSEILNFQKIKGENLLNIAEVLRTENHFYVVYEFLEDLNLQTIIDSKGPLPDDQLISIFIDILLGYYPFYTSKKLHRNILSKNVYKSEGRYKLLNFPFTESLKTKAFSSYFYYKNAVPPYEELDTYLKVTLNHKVDVWAMGVLFYEIVFGVVPFSGDNKEDLLESLENKIKNQKKFLSSLPNPKSRKISKDLEELLEKMLQFEPDQRLSFTEILSQQYFLKKKKEQEAYINEYYKQIKHDLDNDLNEFKSLDSELKNSLKSCLSLCFIDPLKLFENDMLEIMQDVPNQFGKCCQIVFRLQFLENNDKEELVFDDQKTSLGSFPYQKQTITEKNKPVTLSLEDSDPEALESKGDFSEEFKMPPPKLNPTYEKLLNENLGKIDDRLDEIKHIFKKQMLHEMEIINFYDNIIQTLNQAFEEKTIYSNEMDFVLSKFLYIKVEFMKSCLLKKENLFLIENWKTQVMYLNFDNWINNLKKLSEKYFALMKKSFESIKGQELTDKKLASFINFETDITEADEKKYSRVFLKLAFDLKDLLEKNNQKILSKFGYGVILKLLKFVEVYEKNGFFKCDFQGEIDVIKMTHNINAMDKEKMKKEIVTSLKSFMPNI